MARSPKTRQTPSTKTLAERAEDLGPAGKTLWAELGKTLALEGAAGALALEAARTLDRLDDLENLIAGRGFERLWHYAQTDLAETADGLEVHLTVTIDGLLAEARQQQNTLRSSLQALGVAQLQAMKKGGGILDQLAARRAAREEGRGSAPEGLQSSE